MNRTLFVLIFIISCTGNTTEDDFANPSTIKPNIECDESKQILSNSATKMLQELGFATSNLNQAIIKFQHQNQLEVTGKLNANTYYTLLDKPSKFKIGAEIYAIEKIKCEKYGQWVQFYKGTLKQIVADTVILKLVQRYGFKHNPTKTGVSTTDWFCVPKQKYCYSEIDFHAWQGKYQPNDMVKFPITDAFITDITSEIEKRLQQKCN
ncbi:peptidoglycan-binding domain-containing protein [Candidatus Halobeggiatoa sp. HSG11]|nr:peptidoglycan-binding domain-containing protein [Candidatus Halobeggiatoa sp. HSG11]